jgi:hypothetical protein
MNKMRTFILKYLILSGVMLILGCGETPPEPPTSPIFDDVEKIDLITPLDDDDHSTTISASSIDFLFDIPSDVKYVMVGIFTEDIDVVGDKIVNDTDCVAGSRSGLSGFSRSSIPAANMRVFNPASGDFTATTFASTVSGSTDNYYWAVWGYDEGQNLTHASPRWRVRISWP